MTGCPSVLSVLSVLRKVNGLNKEMNVLEYSDGGIIDTEPCDPRCGLSEKYCGIQPSQDLSSLLRPNAYGGKE